jgi:V8-like Glu-specific endopeptidase
MTKRLSYLMFALSVGAAFAFAFACANDSEPAAESDEVVETTELTATGEGAAEEVLALTPAQALGRYELPDRAWVIPAEQIEYQRSVLEGALDPQEKRFPIGVHIELPALPGKVWERIVGLHGDVSFRLAIHAENASFVRPHFVSTPLGEDVEIFVYGADETQPARSAAPTSTAGSDDYWGPRVNGPTLFVEVLGTEVVPRVVIDQVAVGFLPPVSTESWCYKDPTCYSAWNTTKTGVAYVAFEDYYGSWLCSGSLLNDTGSTGTPWFLTANHCVSTQGVADSSEVVWNYHTSTCNGAVPNFWNLPRTYGSERKCTSTSGDYTLLRLDAAPPAGVTFLGWTTGNVSYNADVTTIHHPGGAWKRISFAKVVGTGGNYWTVRYHTSSTEGGSSGAPLFNSSKKVIGQLHGGSATCDYMSGTDTFGKFKTGYNACYKNYLVTK